MLRMSRLREEETGGDGCPFLCLPCWLTLAWTQLCQPSQAFLLGSGSSQAGPFLALASLLWEGYLSIHSLLCKFSNDIILIYPLFHPLLVSLHVNPICPTSLSFRMAVEPCDPRPLQSALVSCLQTPTPVTINKGDTAAWHGCKYPLPAPPLRLGAGGTEDLHWKLPSCTQLPYLRSAPHSAREKASEKCHQESRPRSAQISAQHY